MKNAGIKLVFFIISIVLFSCDSSRKDTAKTEIKPFSMTMDEVIAEMKPYEGPNSEDQSESTNLYDKNPKIVKKMTEELERIQSQESSRINLLKTGSFRYDFQKAVVLWVWSVISINQLPD